MQVSLADLLDLIVSRCMAAGMDELAARRTAAHLAASDLAGRHAHGTYRLGGILRGAYDAQSPRVSRDSNFLSVTATGVSGIAAMVFACDAVRSSLAERTGAVVAAVAGYIGGTGSLGWYSRMLADAGVVSFIVCNSESAVAVPGTGTPFGGTNPVSIGVPGSPPFVADFASTVMAYGELRMQALAGEPLAEGIVVTSSGEPSRRYDDADEGAMLGFGGHKGFVLSLAIELLCGYLAGAKIAREAEGGDGAILVGVRVNTPGRPDAVSIARDRLTAISPTAHMPGDRLAKVPSAFLWGEDHDRGWIDGQAVDLPEYVVSFLADRDIVLAEEVRSSDDRRS